MEGVPALSVYRALLDAMGRIPTNRIDTALADAMSRGLLERREHAHVNWVLVNVHDCLVTPPFEHIEPVGTRHGISARSAHRRNRRRARLPAKSSPGHAAARHARGALRWSKPGASFPWPRRSAGPGYVH